MPSNVITLHKASQSAETVSWLVGYHDTVYRVTTRRTRRNRDRLGIMRYAICKATRLDARQFRFIGNKRMHGMWISEWARID